jgi:hypothetical protein
MGGKGRAWPVGNKGEIGLWIFGAGLAGGAAGWRWFWGSYRPGIPEDFIEDKKSFVPE